jgi:Lhr-like helicase
MVSVRRIVANDIKRMALKIVAPMIARYLTEEIHLADGRVLSGQSAFDYAVENDKDLVALMKKYHPEYMEYVERARRALRDMDVDVDDALGLLLPYIRKRGIRVDERGEEYLRRQVGKFMELLRG